MASCAPPATKTLQGHIVVSDFLQQQDPFALNATPAPLNDILVLGSKTDRWVGKVEQLLHVNPVSVVVVKVEFAVLDDLAQLLLVFIGCVERTSKCLCLFDAQLTPHVVSDHSCPLRRRSQFRFAISNSLYRKPVQSFSSGLIGIYQIHIKAKSFTMQWEHNVGVLEIGSAPGIHDDPVPQSEIFRAERNQWQFDRCFLHFQSELQCELSGKREEDGPLIAGHYSDPLFADLEVLVGLNALDGV